MHIYKAQRLVLGIQYLVTLGIEWSRKLFKIIFK